MPRIIIINIFLFLFSGIKIYGQSLNQDSLLDFEKKYFYCQDEKIKQDLLIHKVNYYLRKQVTGGNVVNEIKRIKTNEIRDPQLKIDFLWNAALVMYLNEEKDHSRFYLEQYKKYANDSSISTGLLDVLVYKFEDTVAVNKQLIILKGKDSLFGCLSCFNDAVKYNKKHLNAYLISSALIPGSGTALNGAVLKGLISLALVSASVFGIVKMVEYGLYINAVLWGTGVGLKFYAGSILLTEKQFYKAETKQKNKLTTECELILEKILAKYPLNLKGL